MESFEDYYERWPNELSAIPQTVVKDWIYRHWEVFKQHWIELCPHLWNYRLVRLSNEEIYAIDHIGTWIADLDDEGVEYTSGAPRSSSRLARHMLLHGTWPIPILVAEHAGHVRHPRSVTQEAMKEPFQLIEGHSRLGCMRGMINALHQGLASEHEVWLVTIPPFVKATDNLSIP